MKRATCFFALLLALVLSGSVSVGWAAPPTPEPPRRLVVEQLEELPFLDSGVPQPFVQDVTPSADLAAWSKIVFQSYRDNNWEIYLANGDGSAQTRLTNTGRIDAGPRLNRGCTRVAFYSDRTPDHNYDIFAMNLDGSGVSQLTSNGADDYAPAWSPDGSKLAFSSYRDGQVEIYVMNADGSGQTRLTFDGAYDGMPAWSPDGSKIAFVSARTGGNRIWVMNADGSGQTQLSTQAYSESPAWSPDGSQIAYDSDGDGDGWQELWLMNADGSNQREVYDPGWANTDAWARSWSPDGRYIAFTRISFTNYQGDWYWVAAYLDAWDSTTGDIWRLGSQNVEWHPGWEACDNLAPTSSVNALPAQSPGQITLRWAGSDVGLSGLKNYDVQFSDGITGTWANIETGTQGTMTMFFGISGHTYYFRSRARDNAGNVEAWPSDYDTFTTIEALAPTSYIKPLPAYSHPNITVQWNGQDAGGSGINTYDVQYRDAAGGSWTDWQTYTGATSAVFSGTLGHTYYFRSRAVDFAQNLESWPAGNGDALTTFYAWGVSGIAKDNTDTPVAGAVVTTTPGALDKFASDSTGAFAAYVGDSSDTYTVTWGKAGYGGLPETRFNALQDAQVDVVLPPADNVVVNGNFESGNLEDWLASGVITPVITDVFRHTGNYAVMLGQQFAFTLPISISQSLGSSTPLQFVADMNGIVHIVWGRYQDGNFEIYYSQRNSNGNWSSPHSVAGVYHDGFLWPEMVVDKHSIVHVIWRQNTLGHDEVFHAWRNSSGVWSSPQNISNTPNSALSCQMVVDEDDVLHVIWIDEVSGNTTPYYIQRSAAGVWSAPELVPGSMPDAWRMAVDKNGTVHAVWLTNDGLNYVQRNSSGTWSSPQLSLWSTSYPNSLKMVVDENSNVSIVWGEGDNIYYAERRAGDALSTPVEISGSTAGWWPEIAVSKNGLVHVVWVGYGVFHTWKNEHGVWSSPQQAPGSEYSSQQGVSIAIDDMGVVHALWSYALSYDDWKLYYARWTNGLNDWTYPKLVKRVYCTTGPATLLAVEGNGNIHVAWHENNGWDGVLYLGMALAEQSGDSTITQVITVPVAISTPALSFLYQLGGTSQANGGKLYMQANSGITTTTIFSTATNADSWTHRWFDLSQWTGQTVTLTFSVHQVAGQPRVWAYLDEVSLGSAYPDVWVSKAGPDSLSGGPAIYHISYGNRGGAPASGARITDTLPAGLTFVSANPPPITTTLPLVWDVGDLAAKSGPFAIVLTATVAPTAPMLSTLTNTVDIDTISPELETANNEAFARTFIGHQLYLPLVLKNY